jgi:uncharacterized membrane protein YkoI
MKREKGGGTDMMIKKSIIAIVAIIAAVGLVFAAYGGTGDNNPTNTSNNLEKQQTSSAAITTNTNTATKKEKTNTNNIISASKAKEIAQKYIEVSTATTGTPKLIKSDKTLIYVVPIVDNGQVVGEIEINALTGENVGGAGGAP